MIKNSFNDLYVGVTANPGKRLEQHNSHRGAKFTENKTIFHIAFLEPYDDFATARKREIQIKKWRRDKKEKLIKRYVSKLPTKFPSL